MIIDNKIEIYKTPLHFMKTSIEWVKFIWNKSKNNETNISTEENTSENNQMYNLLENIFKKVNPNAKYKQLNLSEKFDYNWIDFIMKINTQTTTLYAPFDIKRELFMSWLADKPIRNILLYNNWSSYNNANCLYLDFINPALVYLANNNDFITKIRKIVWNWFANNKEQKAKYGIDCLLNLKKQNSENRWFFIKMQNIKPEDIQWFADNINWVEKIINLWNWKQIIIKYTFAIAPNWEKRKFFRPFVEKMKVNWVEKIKYNTLREYIKVEFWGNYFEWTTNKDIVKYTDYFDFNWLLANGIAELNDRTVLEYKEKQLLKVA